MIVVVDSGIANIGSVSSAFRRIGAAISTTSDASTIESATAVVLPGVGAFADGMASLRHRGLVEAIRTVAQRGTPILGICLGMQLLADASEEFGLHDGLGLIRGRAVRLDPGSTSLRVPNIGWCDVSARDGARLFSTTDDRRSFYFAHSYHLQCEESADVAATMRFGDGQVAVSIERDNIFGVQFHPEKSQDAGLEVLSSFVAQV